MDLHVDGAHTGQNHLLVAGREAENGASERHRQISRVGAGGFREMAELTGANSCIYKGYPVQRNRMREQCN